MMLVSNALTLRAVWITPSLRVKAYALTTSMVVSNLILAIVLVNFFVHEALGAMPCSLTLYKAAVRPVERWAMYSSLLHVSFIAIDRYIAIKYALNYENRVTQLMTLHFCCEVLNVNADTVLQLKLTGQRLMDMLYSCTLQHNASNVQLR